MNSKNRSNTLSNFGSFFFLLILVSCNSGSSSKSKHKKLSTEKLPEQTVVPEADKPDLVTKDPEEICESKNLNKAVIGGELNWYSRAEIEDFYEKENSQAVGQLYLPAVYASCTAFLINENTIMTNNHCVSSQWNLKNSKFKIYDRDGARKTYTCNEFIITDFQLDMTLIKCKGSPGRTHSYVRLNTSSLLDLPPVYVVQENCNYEADPYCVIDRYISYGDILEKKSNRYVHTADTLKGSSGSPVISMSNHKVVALHHASSAPDSDVVENYGVSMAVIVKFLKKNAPQVKIDTNLPPVDINPGCI